MSVDLSRLPPPDVVEALDFEALLSARIARLIDLTPPADQPAVAAVLALESEPLTKLLQESAYRELILRQRINDAARAIMLASAIGTDLDQLGALFDVRRLPDEPDERLRARIQQGFASLAAAGPAAAYRAHVMAVSSAIADASVESSAPGRVDVAVLGWESALAATADADAAALGQRLFPGVPVATGQAAVLAANDSALLGAVRTALSAETVRPLTDQVVVVAPAVKSFAITARLLVYRGPDPATVLQQSTAALAAYLTRVRRLGYDVTRAGIIAALGVPAVQNVLLDSPAADIVCTPAEIADPHPITVSVEGVAE